MTTLSKIALAILAHPDDAEFTCAGTMCLLREQGWTIHIATMTPGQCGSADLGPEQISEIRREEAARAAAVLDGYFECLECQDCFVRHDRETVLNTIALVRRIKPAVIFAHPRLDYICDHEAASLIARDAAFWAGVPNIATPGADPLTYVPHLYYVDPVEGKDLYGQIVVPGIVADIGTAMATKERMLVCHASQREWLMKHHGMDEYTETMKALGKARGALAGFDYGEGFRQHLGHGYPQDDLLARVLGARIKPIGSARDTSMRNP